MSTLSLAGLAAAAGVAEADLHEAARLLGGKKSVAVIFGSDVMRGSDAAATIQALSNLALLTGCIGKDAGGFFPIDEKNNTVGLLDMGVCPRQSSRLSELLCCCGFRDRLGQEASRDSG